MPVQVGNNAEGAKIAGEILGAATNARWPMYLRNVKQILRTGGFDERAYGFGGLMDLLRACQREGTVRLERDRRGGLRVMQGPSLVRSVMPAVEPAEAVADGVDRTPARSRVYKTTELEPDMVESAPVAVVDTTAELLGRAKPRRPRTRAIGSAHSAASGGNTPARGHEAEREPTASRRCRSAQEKHGQPAPQPLGKNSDRGLREKNSLAAPPFQKVHPLFDERHVRAVALFVRRGVRAGEASRRRLAYERRPRTDAGGTSTRRRGNSPPCHQGCSAR